MIPDLVFPHYLRGWCYTGNAHAFACTVDSCAESRKGRNIDPLFATSLMCLDAPEFIPTESLRENSWRFAGIPATRHREQP